MDSQTSGDGAGGVIPPEALARVPGFSPAARIRALTGGTVNRSFSVETNAGRYFLRLHEAAGLALGADHAREAHLQEAAAAAGLAPRLVYADPHHRFAISEFLAGRVWMPADFAQPAQLDKLGATLRRVHEVMPPIAAPFDLPALLNGFADRISTAVPDEQPTMERLMERARRSLLSSGCETRSATLFHSDPHHSNLIELQDGRVLLIDWEYAAVGDPLFDIACVLAYYPLAAPHACRLLQAAGLADLATPAMLEHEVWLYSLLGYLWYRARRLEIDSGVSASQSEFTAERAMLDRLG